MQVALVAARRRLVLKAYENPLLAVPGTQLVCENTSTHQNQSSTEGGPPSHARRLDPAART